MISNRHISDRDVSLAFHGIKLFKLHGIIFMVAFSDTYLHVIQHLKYLDGSDLIVSSEDIGQIYYILFAIFFTHCQLKTNLFQFHNNY